MLNQFPRCAWITIVALACCLICPQPAQAQFEFLKDVFGGKARQKTPLPFRGHAALSQAVIAAENGDLEKSFTLAAAAFREGGLNDPLEHPEIRMIAPNVLRLSKVWEAKEANPADVVPVLMEIVLPAKLPGIVRPYPGQWALTYDMNLLALGNGRVAAPESIGTELVRWAVRAKQTDEVRKRLSRSKPEPPTQGKDSKPNATSPMSKMEDTVAAIFSVQLAVAEQDSKSVNQSLTSLIDVAKSANAPLLEYLCHAVMASLTDVKSEQASLFLLEAVLNQAEQSLPIESGLRMNAPWLRVKAASRHAQASRPDDAKRCALAAIATPLENRFGADYTVYLNHQLKQQAAAALIDAGLILDGLDLAGQSADPRALRYSRSEGSTNLAAKIGGALRKLPPTDRLALLRKWALPEGDRDAVRSVIDFVPINSTDNLGSGIVSDVFSTDRELIATAQELGQLDDFIRELSAITPASPSVQALQTLALVMRDGGPNASQDQASTLARLKTLLDTTTAGVPNWDVQNKPQPPTDTYVIAVEAAIHPPWRETAQAILYRLIEHSQRTQSSRPRDHFRLAWAETLRLRSFDVLPDKEINGRAAGPDEVKQHWLKLLPKNWDSIGFESAAERAMGALSPFWFTHEGALTHVSSGRESDLVFGVPLTGTFELTLECREGGWSEGRVGYGGAGFQIFAYQDGLNLSGKGNSGYESSPRMTNLLNKEPWNRYTIRVNGNSVKYFAQGQPAFEDQPGTAAPWLTLSGTPGFTPSYRNLRITGSPTIPREVALIGDERLRGWLATHFDESKPDALRTRKYIQVKVDQNGQTLNYIVEDDGTMEGEPAQVGQRETDWMVVEGELRSARRREFFGRESPSRLTYQRPLRDGETVRFECWYQPGVTTVQPSFGETIYALGALDDKHQNSVPSSRGSMQRPCAGEFKEGWNSVAMSLSRGLLSISLNGKEIVLENITPTNSRRIGFFHDAATSNARVRNVMLTGDWPKEFDASVKAAIETPEPVEKLGNSRFLTYMMNEAYISDNAYEIARQAVQLDTQERYQFLHRWVIPNESHDLMRTSGALTPAHPVPSLLDQNPIDTALAEARIAVDGRMVQTGGNFVCPAILLVLAAAELDRLTELREEAAAFNPISSGEMARNRAALLGIINLLEDRPEEAIARLRECQALLVQYPDAAIYSRWGDVALASLAIQHPTTREAAFELLTFIQSNQLQAGRSGPLEFGRFVRQLHGQCLFLMHGGPSEEFGTQPKSKQWRSVAQPRARSRGTGVPIASFDMIAGEMAQRGGQDFDVAYFQSPLRGNYEVTCRLSHFDWREAMVMSAGIANALDYSQDKIHITRPMKTMQQLPLADPITPRVFQWHDYKIAVNNGRYTSYVNGQKLHEEQLPAEHDPWLAVVGWGGHSSRAVRDLIIRGEPVIPKELDLLGSPDFTGWMVDYFAAEWGQTPFEWKLDGGVLSSPQTVDANGRNDRRRVENIVRYHRPMLEDGVIRYEFFYDPEVKLAAPPGNQLSYLGPNAPKRTIKGQTIVHPALDRMVCVLEPEGVKLHWMTDARWDRTGLTADNVEDIRESKPLPLKSQEWNAIAFRTSGDTLAIELNGETILNREIEPTNLRHFGLFHYSNQSNVRVRNIRYQGKWPAKLPSIADQELAGGLQSLAMIPDADLPDVMTWDFTKSKFNRDEFGWVWNSEAEKYITPTAAGLHYVMPAGIDKPQVAGITPKVRIQGDFITTIDYENLKTVAAETNWGSGLSFNVTLDGSYQLGLEVREATKSAYKVTNASQTIFAAHRPHLFLNDAINEFATAGRLRIQRKGPVLYYFTAPAGSDKFRLLTQRPTGTNDIHHLGVNADASDKASGADFIVKNLSIRAAKIIKGK